MNNIQLSDDEMSIYILNKNKFIKIDINDGIETELVLRPDIIGECCLVNVGNGRLCSFYGSENTTTYYIYTEQRNSWNKYSAEFITDGELGGINTAFLRRDGKIQLFNLQGRARNYGIFNFNEKEIIYSQAGDAEIDVELKSVIRLNNGEFLLFTKNDLDIKQIYKFY